MPRPVILVSNDDGIQAPGLHALCEAMGTLGQVVVVAPDIERSAAGHAITIADPLRVDEIDLGMKGVMAYACSGTPADCVKLATVSILPKPPDLVVSGINRGSNTGINVIYSGTVSAATEGTILGIPSIAFSLDSWSEPNFGPAKSVAIDIAAEVLKRGLPKGTLLNVNIPSDYRASEMSTHQTGFRLTSHGKSIWEDEFDKRVDPHNRVYYWLNGRHLETNEPENSDMTALRAGQVSVTPLHYDLTDYNSLNQLSNWGIFRQTS